MSWLKEDRLWQTLAMIVSLSLFAWQLLSAFRARRARQREADEAERLEIIFAAIQTDQQARDELKQTQQLVDDRIHTRNQAEEMKDAPTGGLAGLHRGLDAAARARRPDPDRRDP
jgi:Na+-transporting NADH:ubiquinone oxidoreductase subunit NqrC